uniref:DUF1534 domain-containing protein n=1 Tax=Steinernema glaseri TaxID=37863 RepID=A0A1I7YMS4_9BILA
MKDDRRPTDRNICASFVVVAGTVIRRGGGRSRLPPLHRLYPVLSFARTSAPARSAHRRHRRSLTAAVPSRPAVLDCIMT